MNIKHTFLTALAFTLPLPSARAQQWTPYTLPTGLIAWWAAEGDMLDSAGLHHGSGSTPPTYAPGRYGQAFQFNGTDQSVTVSDVHADLDDWTQFTLEAWFNLDQTADFLGGRMIFSKVGNANDHTNFNQGYQFGIHSNATKIALAFNPGGQPWPASPTIASLAAPLAIHTWHHLVGTYDHNEVRIYLNGVLLVSNVIGPVTLQNSSSSLRISKDDNLNVPFAGRIDDARIYNRALSAAEVTYLYQGPTPPVHLGLKLHLDANNVNGDGTRPTEGSAVTTWRDIGGLGLDATPLFTTAPVYRTNALNGRSGVDFSLSGSDALATVFTNQLNFTDCTIFMVGNGAGSPTHVSISAPLVNQEFMLFDKSIHHHTSPYHWVARSHQDSPAGYYIQAGLLGTKSNELANCINGVFSTSALALGQQPGAGDYVPVARQAILGWRNADALGGPPIYYENFDGVICEVLVYDRQLSGSEVDGVNLFLSNKYGIPVTPIPPLLRLGAAAGGTAPLQWDSALGRQYQIQSSTSLTPTSWVNEGAPFIGTGGVLSTNVPTGPEPRKFFRLQLSGN